MQQINNMEQWYKEQHAEAVEIASKRVCKAIEEVLKDLKQYKEGVRCQGFMQV